MPIVAQVPLKQKMCPTGRRGGEGLQDRLMHVLELRFFFFIL